MREGGQKTNWGRGTKKKERESRVIKRLREGRSKTVVERGRKRGESVRNVGKRDWGNRKRGSERGRNKGKGSLPGERS